MRNYSIARKRGQWPAPEDTSLSNLISILSKFGFLRITLRWVRVAITAAPYTIAMFVYKVGKFRLKFRQKLKWVRTQRKISSKS